MKPTRITGLSNITAISSATFIAADASGFVWFWGTNWYGQYGNGNPNTIAGSPYNLNVFPPTIITGLSRITSVCSGPSSCFAVDSSGNVWFWGWNGYGIMGNGNTNSATPSPTTNFTMSPTKITDLSNITAVSNGSIGGLAIDSSKNVWFWGKNVYGQLGNGNTNTTSAPSTNMYYMTPTQITGLSNITAISAEVSKCLALDTSGNVWFWGVNTYGILGNGNTNTTSAPSTNNYYMTPTQITGLSNITAISIFAYGALALDTTGNVWFWGQNIRGWLGNNNPNSNSTAFTYYNCYMIPTQITGLSNISSISINRYACLAV
jgi:alpha-tubulin suppressor-like RCC1 family protein